MLLKPYERGKRMININVIFKISYSEEKRIGKVTYRDLQQYWHYSRSQVGE